MSYLVDPLGTHPVPHAVLPWLLKAAHHERAGNEPREGPRGDPRSGPGDTDTTGDQAA